MAITITCPACERALKVKDELAGRKIKCPQCGSVIAVIAKEANSEARITAKKPQPSRVVDDDDDELEDERPRKKKKKKGKSNQGLIIGAAVGGVAIVAVVVVILLLNIGDGTPNKGVQKKNNPGPVAQNPEREEPVLQGDPMPEKRAPAGAIARVREGTVDRNKLRQLGLAYMNFVDTLKRGPNNQQEFSSYYENDHEINNYLTKKWITFIWGTNRQSFPDGTSNTMLAYETDPDRAGIRLALFGDGSVNGLDEEAFQKTPKAKGK